MKLSKSDKMLVARYVDGELGPAERKAVDRRLETDTVLRTAVDEALDQSALLRSVDGAPDEAPAGFARSVLDTIRRMPARAELVEQAAQEESVGQAAVFARRLAMAAAVLFAVALVFGIQAFVQTDTDYVQASKQELQELDKKVKAMKVEDLRRQRNR